MGCDKTDHLIKLLVKFQKYSGLNAYVFGVKPSKDTRSDTFEARTGVSFSPFFVVDYAYEIMNLIKNAPDQSQCIIVGISETQFFDSGLIEIIDSVKGHNVYMILEGLDKNFRGEPFLLEGYEQSMSNVEEHVDEVIRLSQNAICQEIPCTRFAEYTQRLVWDELNALYVPAPWANPSVVIGEVDQDTHTNKTLEDYPDVYQARCGDHIVIPLKLLADSLRNSVIAMQVKYQSRMLKRPMNMKNLLKVGENLSYSPEEIKAVINTLKQENQIVVKQDGLFYIGIPDYLTSIPIENLV